MHARLQRRYEADSHLDVYFDIGEQLHPNTEVGSGKD
jgi:hypothetical protein